MCVSPLNINQPILLTPLYPVAEHATTIGCKEAAKGFKGIVSLRPTKGVRYYNENYARIGKSSYFSSECSLTFSVDWLKMDVE